MAKHKIALALQGGGSHGAFTWGVLEALLADGRLEIEGLSGTSAGGMNAAALVQGLIRDGNRGGAEALERYWRGVHELGSQLAPMLLDPIGKMLGDYNLRTSMYSMMAAMIRPVLDQCSPYVLNPTNADPFRTFAEQFFDFQAIQRSDRHRLFLAATHVETGKIKVFTNEELTIDALMATACLPTLFQAVQVEGEYYWDGGFIANPAIYPLINECTAKDIVVVQLTKARCPHVPKERQHIMERFSEITFNSCLIREIRAIYFMTRLIDEGKVRDPGIRRINLHIIRDDSLFQPLTHTSALNTDWDFLNFLRHAGHKCGERWIRESFDKLGMDIPFSPSMIEAYV